MQNYFETVKMPLFAADFDYFRISYEKWALMLTRLTQMGVNLVTISIPWGFHEFDRGTVDFTGATNARHNVTGLLDLCNALNLPCILKPGPYNNNGVLGNGLPNWLLGAPDNLDTLLPVAVESWFQAMSKMLVSQQWPAGPIIALQVDSEPSQKQPVTYSEQLTEIKWPIWLRKHYKGMEALNAAYGANYHSVNQVKFPQTWSQETTPLEEDAKAFLEEVQHETQASCSQILTEAGWQIPIYPVALDTQADLPTLLVHSLLNPQELSTLASNNTIIVLQHPIQVDPDPVDIGSEPVWASNAPIRTDASLRQTFWSARQYLWQQILPDTDLENKTLTAHFESGGLETSASDTTLRISLVKGTKPAAYHLYLNGELMIDNNLKASRGKLRGPYLAEDDMRGQTDFIVFLNEPTAPVNGFLLAYLRNLLITQTETLARCAGLATELGQRLAPTPDSTQVTPPDSHAPTSYTLAEARRGLSEADAAMRKAMASIGALETGFDTILGKSGPKGVPSQPAAGAIAIGPEIFEGAARDILLEIGSVCMDIAPQLQSTAEVLQNTIDQPNGFTVEQYQQSYASAVATAQTSRESLLKFIAQLRIEIASERLPLVIWRIHDQIQTIAESLRWGVLRR